MKSPVVPTLLALSVIGSSALHAVDIGDDSVKLTVGTILQPRAEVSSAKDATGHNYDITGPADNSKSDTADFYMRRARFSFKAVYREDTGMNLTLRADGADRASNGATGTNSRSALIQQAFVYHKFVTGDVTHQLQIGIDYAFHNWGVNVCPAGMFLLPNIAPWDARMANNRAAGVGYRMNSPMVTFGADVQNNHNDDSTAGTPAATNKSEGLWYSARVELTGPGDLAIKDQESFVGKPGTGFRIGLEAADNSDDRVAATSSKTTVDYGIDGLFHWDGLSARAGANWDTTKTKNDVGANPADIKSFAWGVEGGYAFPVDKTIIEPAVRYSRVNLNKDVQESAPYDPSVENEDAGGSGSQVDVGLNFYWAGHNSKSQLEYTHWKAETGDAKAEIFRLQETLWF